MTISVRNIKNLRSNVDPYLARGISPREAKQIVNDTLGWGGQPPSNAQRQQLAAIAEIFAPFFTTGARAVWKKETGIAIQGNQVVYPNGFLPVATLDAVRAKAAAEGRQVREDWIIRGSPASLVVKPRPLTLTSAMAKIPPTRGFWQVAATNARGGSLSWVFSKDHKVYAARCMVYLSQQGWRDIQCNVKTAPSTMYKHMWNPKAPPYK